MVAGRGARARRTPLANVRGRLDEAEVLFAVLFRQRGAGHHLRRAANGSFSARTVHTTTARLGRSPE